MSTDGGVPGVIGLDHTADVGIEIRAATRAELFVRAGQGMGWLILGGDREQPAMDPTSAPATSSPSSAPRLSGAPEAPPAATPRTTQERPLTLSADDLPTLLREWLRELLYWHESEALSFDDVRFDDLSDTHLEAVVTVSPDSPEPIREIKGVTLHGLAAERQGEGWFGRVIFDV